MIKKYRLLLLPLLLLVGISVGQYFSLWRGQSCYFLRYFPACGPLSPWWLIVLILSFAFALWLAFYYRLWPPIQAEQPASTKLWAVLLAIALLAVTINQFATADPEYYFNAGRAVHYQINPYLQEYAGGNPFSLTAMPVMPAGVMYGPLILRFFAADYDWSHGNIYLFVWILKAASLLLFIFCAWLLARLIQEKKQYLAVWLFSPLVLFEWLASAHFDGLWLALVLGAYVAANKKRWWLAWPLLALAVWLKFVPAIFAPVLLLWWWQEFNWRRAHDWYQAVAAVILSAVATLLSWWGLWGGLAVFQGIALQSKWAMHSVFYVLYYSAARLIGPANEQVYHYLLSGGLQLALLLAALWLIWPLLIQAAKIILRQEKFSAVQYGLLTFVGLAAYLLLVQKSLWPWYFIWLLPFGLLAASEIAAPQLRKLLIWFGAGPLLFYVFWFTDGAQSGNYYFATYACFILTLYPLYQLCLWRRQDFSLTEDQWAQQIRRLLRMPLTELGRLGFQKTKPFHGQFVKYFVTGISAFALDMLTLYAFKEWLGLTPTWATVINQVLMLNFVFFVNKLWSFKATGLTHRQAMRYLIVAGGNYLFAIAWMFVFNHLLQWDYLAVRAVNIILAVSWNFLLYKFFVYKK